MTTEIFIVYLIALGALYLFFRDDVISVDLTAILILIVLIIAGILTVEEGFSGFSHTGTIAVAAMLVLSEAVNKSGALEYLTKIIRRAPLKSEFTLTFILVAAAGTVSAFVSNTATMLIFLPLTLAVFSARGLAPSRALIPMAFVVTLGGTCTLVGSSTNIVLSEFATRYGLERIGVFELAPVGVLAALGGLLYSVTVARRLMPKHLAGNNETKQPHREYISEFIVPEKGSPVEGKSFSDISKEEEVSIMVIIRQGARIWDAANVPLNAGDVLLVHGNIEKIMEIRKQTGLHWKKEGIYDDLKRGDGVLAEAVVAPSSSLAGHTLKEVRFKNRYNAFVLALRTFGSTVLDKIGHIRLHVGDTLLIYGRKDNIADLRGQNDFLFLETVDVPIPRPARAITTVAILVAVILLAAFNILPLVVAEVVGVLFLALFGAMDLKGVYSAIPWRIILMLAGIIPLGIAFDKTGAATLLAGLLLKAGKPLGVLAVLSIIYWLGAFLVEIIQKTPTAVLITPIAIAVATEMGINPRAALIMVLFSASSCFATPVSYQVNAIVYGAGRYAFRDYLKAGIPLKIILWLIAIICVPIFWPS